MYEQKDVDACVSKDAHAPRTPASCAAFCAARACRAAELENILFSVLINSSKSTSRIAPSRIVMAEQ
jgi:hypothetical protein